MYFGAEGKSGTSDGRVGSGGGGVEKHPPPPSFGLAFLRVHKVDYTDNKRGAVCHETVQNEEGGDACSRPGKGGSRRRFFVNFWREGEGGGRGPTVGANSICAKNKN